MSMAAVGMKAKAKAKQEAEDEMEAEVEVGIKMGMKVGMKATVGQLHRRLSSNAVAAVVGRLQGAASVSCSANGRHLTRSRSR